MKKEIDVHDARKILRRALTPEQSEILRQVDLVEKRIKIACAHKCEQCVFSVFTEFKQKEQQINIAIMVATELKRRGFKVKIRGNEIKICWHEEKGDAEAQE